MGYGLGTARLLSACKTVVRSRKCVELQRCVNVFSTLDSFSVCMCLCVWVYSLFVIFGCSFAFCAVGYLASHGQRKNNVTLPLWLISTISIFARTYLCIARGSVYGLVRPRTKVTFGLIEQYFFVCLG